MARPNYNFQKQQRELAKKQRKEQKKLKKAGPGEPGLVSTDGEAAVSDTAVLVTTENKTASGT